MDDQKIAIIGAGAAGLTAAVNLRELGYRNVRVFERSNRVGGKCCSVTLKGRCYELGAGIVSQDNTEVMRLVDQLQIPLERLTGQGSTIVDGETGVQLPKRTLRETCILLRELVTYGYLLLRFRRLGEPGFRNIDPALTVPFADFARTHHITHLADVLALYFTGFGYDYFERVSAAYVLKYYSWPTVTAFLKRRIYRLPDGIQHLWTAVAADLDIRYKTNIKKIERTRDGVHLFHESGSEQFDALIIASPLDETLGYLDATPEEDVLFRAIRYVDYCTIACSVQGLPKGDGYVPSNFVSRRPGQPLFWYHRHHNTDIYTFYALAESQTDAQLVEATADLVQKMGGTITTTHSVTHWKYFPHLSGEDLRTGVMDHIEVLQGNRHTYFVGEFFNFSTVGRTAEYAADLIRTQFPRS